MEDKEPNQKELDQLADDALAWHGDPEEAEEYHALELMIAMDW